MLANAVPLENELEMIVVLNKVTLPGMRVDTTPEMLNLSLSNRSFGAEQASGRAPEVSGCELSISGP